MKVEPYRYDYDEDIEKDEVAVGKVCRIVNGKGE